MFLRILKGTQLAVAVATTAASLTGLLLPGVMSLLFAPLALLYVILAVRAARDHRFSIWLSLAVTILVAVLVGALGASMTNATFGARFPSEGAAAPLAVDAAGNIAALPAGASPVLAELQARIERRERLHALTLLAIGFAAWVVVALYALEWRWAFVRRRR
jgi:hypothetical protein